MVAHPCVGGTNGEAKITVDAQMIGGTRILTNGRDQAALGSVKLGIVILGVVVMLRVTLGAVVMLRVTPASLSGSGSVN